MSHERPVILELKAITPAPHSARRESLEYGNLATIVEEQRPYEIDRMHEFWDAEPESLEEKSAAMSLAKQYMLMGSLSLQMAGSERAKATLSNRFTQASSEIYGTPDESFARQLWQDQEQGRGIEMGADIERVAASLADYLERKYAPVFDALERNLPESVLSAPEVADRFEAALEVLAQEYDEGWSEWGVDRNDEKDSLSISGSEKKIIVGMHRANMKPELLKGLFSHELLIHAMRSLNGWKQSEELGKGLSGYLDFEEGLGTFVEYAVNGEISQKNIDRYVDIAYVLGQIDGRPHSRAELIGHAMERAQRRNESSASKTSPEDMQKEVYAHVNRIFRGSLGNEHIGIYTKDMMYLKGFLDSARYLAAEIEDGKSVDDTMEYLLTGKFDPSDPSHLQYLRTLQAPLE